MFVDHLPTHHCLHWYLPIPATSSHIIPISLPANWVSRFTFNCCPSICHRFASPIRFPARFYLPLSLAFSVPLVDGPFIVHSAIFITVRWQLQFTCKNVKQLQQQQQQWNAETTSKAWVFKACLSYLTSTDSYISSVSCPNFLPSRRT